MKGRRLNRLMMLCAVLAGLLGLRTGPALAASALIDPAGRLLSIEIATSENDPARQGLVLVEHRLDGTTVRERIEWTFDDVLDTTPVLAIDPRDGQPVVVWSRHEGRDSEIALTRRYADGYWTPVRLLTDDSRQDREPRIAVDSEGGLHVLWLREGRARPSFLLQSFDTDTGSAADDPHRPLEPKPRDGRPDASPGTGDDAGGGSDDPGVIGASRHCFETDHGIMLDCGGVVVYQISGCGLEIGTLDQDGAWQLTRADLGSFAGGGSPSTWQIVRTLAGSACGQ